MFGMRLVLCPDTSACAIRMKLSLLQPQTKGGAMQVPSDQDGMALMHAHAERGP